MDYDAKHELLIKLSIVQSRAVVRQYLSTQTNGIIPKTHTSKLELPTLDLEALLRHYL